MLGRVAAMVDRPGTRRMIARTASLLKRLSGVDQSFEVTADGFWVNRQPEGTLVSPTIHTSSIAALDALVTDLWCWQGAPGPGDKVIDVGAGIGEDALVFARRVGPTGHVLAIEADPETYKCLVETVQRSRLNNVTPVLAAAGDRTGTVRMRRSGSHLSSNIFGDSDEGVEVDMRTIDDLAAAAGFDRIALIKMNIEGAEALAVDGMRGAAARTRQLVISCHDFVADSGGPEVMRTREIVRAKLAALGFTARQRDDPRPWVRDYLYAAGSS